ncbi:MAG: ATPase AAA [Microgenomates group bacterium Gr01-1014_5]|nr:MAG: ATPase AAA [Microgenomates group bacterium Gr01-1014_5]
MIQSQALSTLKTGANVFLTGEPGSGKTHTINQYVTYLRSRGIEPAITASTGIAATHIGGMTIHSWSGIGIKTKLDKRDLNRIVSNKYVTKRVLDAKVLIIEEVSMLTSDTLFMVDTVCRKIKQNSESFGGMQVIFAGDFFQLPPVVKRETEENAQTALIETPLARFAFDSPAWTEANPIVCYLTEQHRQDDNDLLAVLSAIRQGTFNANHLNHIKTRKIEYDAVPDTVPKLFSHNTNVDRINDAVLAKLPGESKVFTMSSQGPDALVAMLKKGCLSPEALYLKIGAAVMFTKNNPKEGFVNGTLGVVEGFNKTNSYPIIKIRNVRLIEVKPMEWTLEENGKVRALISQLPLRLAWAITVHKSQGMNLDSAVMDLSHVFEFGQGYVALSRVRRFSGLYMLGWNERAFQVHPEIVAKDVEFHTQSGQAALEFGSMAESNTKAVHDRFIRECGGKINPGKSSGGTGFDKIREEPPNAYLPWDKTQDEKLRKFFAKGSSVTGLAKTFGRKSGAIRSRLTKLGLLP